MISIAGSITQLLVALRKRIRPASLPYKRCISIDGTRSTEQGNEVTRLDADVLYATRPQHLHIHFIGLLAVRALY